MLTDIITNNNILLDSLRAEVERLNYDIVLKLQLQEEKLRKELTDTFEASIQTNLKQCEERQERKIAMLNREFEAKVCPTIYAAHIDSY